jgi:hypothetical protein
MRLLDHTHAIAINVYLAHQALQIGNKIQGCPNAQFLSNHSPFETL